ncbi:Uncharacterized protein C4orf19, partial [Acanthisitta chloris]
MGCRCCKMIQSYIFDPEEVQSPGCIHEVNSYKHNVQDSNKFQENSENEEQKNELQKDELNRTENKDPVNNTKETLWNHRGDNFQEVVLVKCAAKLDVAVNGGNSCAEGHSMLNPNTNPVKDTSEKGTSSHLEASSASSKDFHTKSNSQRKAACNVPNSIPDSQSAEDSTFLKESTILETQNNAIRLPGTDYPPNSNQTGNYVEKDNFSVNCAHTDQNTGSSAIQDQDLCVSSPSPVKESSTESFKTDSAGLSEGITGGITAVAVTKVTQAPTPPNQKDINGKIEEEDAEIAAALAALEAATAGEDLEDDN